MAAVGVALSGVACPARLTPSAPFAVDPSTEGADAATADEDAFAGGDAPLQDDGGIDAAVTGEPGLADLFSGAARFQPDSEAETIVFDFPSNRPKVWDQKKVVVAPDGAGGLFTVTRGIVSDDAGGERFALFRLRSNDGVLFTEDGALFQAQSDWNLYDAHLTKDESGGWLLTMECDDGVHGPSLCVSRSSTPLVTSSWSPPVRLVTAEAAPARSASTGLALVFGGARFVKWTVVDDGQQPWIEGTESTSVRVAQVADFQTPLSGAGSAGLGVFTADGGPFCTDRWDCNNRDIQDWAVEGGVVYAAYNGGNYYRCERVGFDYGSNDWHLALARAPSPIGPWEASAPIISAPVKDYCSIAYPTLAKIAGQWWMYYATSSPTGTFAAASKRVRLGWATHVAAGPAAPCSVRLPDALSSTNVAARVEAVHCLAVDAVPSAATIASETQAVTSQATTLRSILRGLLDSADFAARWKVGSMNDEAYVFLLYELFLRRLPSPTERTQWTTSLSAKSATRADLADSITSSSELAVRLPFLAP